MKVRIFDTKEEDEKSELESLLERLPRKRLISVSTAATSAPPEGMVWHFVTVIYE